METSGEEVHCELHNLDLSMVVAVMRLKRAIESIEGKIKTLQRWEIFKEIVKTQIRESVADVNLCVAVVVPSCGERQDRVKLSDMSVVSGGSLLYSHDQFCFQLHKMESNE